MPHVGHAVIDFKATVLNDAMHGPAGFIQVISLVTSIMYRRHVGTAGDLLLPT